MPAQPLAYTSHAFGKTPHGVALALPQSENVLKKIFPLLRAQTGHDLDGRIIAWNPGATRMYAIATAERSKDPISAHAPRTNHATPS